MEFKRHRFLHNKATPEAIRAYLLDVGVPPDIIDTIDIHAHSDPTISIYELLPSLIEAYPQIRKYVVLEKDEEQYYNELMRHIRNALNMMVNETYDELDKEMLIDEFGTLNPYYALSIIWAGRVIPDEEVYKLIDEFHINPYDLPDRLREAYLQWKYKLPTGQKQVSNISPRLKDIVKLAKDNQKYFNLDVALGQLPLKVTKEDIPRYLPIILVMHPQEQLAQLDKLTKECPEVYDWVYYEFPRCVKKLKLIYEYVKTNDAKLLADISEEDYKKLEQLFPETMKTLSPIVKHTITKPVEAKPVKQPAKTPSIILVPIPKREKKVWKGINLGEEDLGQEMWVFGDIVKKQYEVKLSKYPKDAVEKAISYVKLRYPYLDESSPMFWQTVEAKVIEYLSHGKFLF